jgi:tetratricopeptide (TPR) repeat protein
MTRIRTPRTLRDALAVALAAAALSGAGCGRRVDPKIQEGYDLVLANKIDQAVALANEILGKNPKSAPAHNLIGLALYKQGDPEGAVQQYREALKLDPKYAEAHFNLGNAYQRLADAEHDAGEAQQHLQDAEAEFAAAVRYQKKFVLAHYNLATVYAATNRPDQAITELGQCTKGDPQFFPAFVLLGKLQYERRDFEGAIASLTRFTELDPTSAQPRILLGNAYLQSGREDALVKAEEAFRAAVGIDSTYIDAVYSVAVALASQNKNEEAAQYFRRAVALSAGRADKEPILKQADRFFARTGLPEQAPSAADSAASSGGATSAAPSPADKG